MNSDNDIIKPWPQKCKHNCKQNLKYHKNICMNDGGFLNEWINYFL